MAPVLIETRSSDFTRWDSMNLLGGFAPFLALFGQEYTNRYLSLTYDYVDWVGFCMVPTGVPYAWSIAMRLLELADAHRKGIFDYDKFLERDQLSTTSDEVCEIWNGHKVERVFSNSSPVTEYIFESKLGLCPSADVLRDSEAELLESAEGISTIFPRRGNELPSLPPNLLLNLTPYYQLRKSWSLAIVGLIFQLSIISLAAVTDFYPPLASKIFDNAPPSLRISAFVFVATGTICLTVGLLCTAHALIRPPQFRNVWRPTSAEGITLVWVQAVSHGNGWQTRPYIIGKRVKKELLSSHKLHGSFDLMQPWLMKLAVASILLGFIIQSVGLSLMHWPVQALQFLAMMTMFTGRWHFRKEYLPEFALPLDDLGEAIIQEALEKHATESLRNSGNRANEVAEQAICHITQGLQSTSTRAHVARSVMLQINTILGTAATPSPDIPKAVNDVTEMMAGSVTNDTENLVRDILRS